MQRQPFGGYGWSSFGTELKAGGPNYVTNFMNLTVKNNQLETSNYKIPKHISTIFESIKNTLKKTEVKKFTNAFNSYVYWCKTCFSKQHDNSNIRGETNYLLYKPSGELIIKVNENDNLYNIACKIMAAELTGCIYTINVCDKCNILPSLDGITFYTGSIIFNHKNQFLNSIKFIDRILISTTTSLSDKCWKKAVKHNCHIHISDPTGNGRIDLLPFLKEQAVSNRFHRYGNLGGEP